MKEDELFSCNSYWTAYMYLQEWRYIAMSMSHRYSYLYSCRYIVYIMTKRISIVSTLSSLADCRKLLANDSQRVYI